MNKPPLEAGVAWTATRRARRRATVRSPCPRREPPRQAPRHIAGYDPLSCAVGSAAWSRPRDAGSH
eukprot:scaffold375_cov378-Prasinococcus_capsulatus_cf.AAC.30